MNPTPSCCGVQVEGFMVHELGVGVWILCDRVQGLAPRGISNTSIPYLRLVVRVEINTVFAFSC